MNGHPSEGGLSDYCDGKEYKTHALFSVHTKALQIHFYYDDVEMCNPLGSKAKIHKLGKLLVGEVHLPMYFTLGNIRPRFRSRLSAIHVVSIVSHPDLQKYGIDAVIKPFIEDIKKLVGFFCSYRANNPGTLTGKWVCI